MIDVSTSAARHSRLKSSTTFRLRNFRPALSASEIKSIGQRSFCGVGIVRAWGSTAPIRLRCHADIRESTNGDAVPCITREHALRIGQGGEGNVEPLAIITKGKPQEKGLSRVCLEAGVRIVEEFVSLKVQDGEGLLITRLFRLPAIIEQRKISAIRAERHGGGETVGPPRLARKRIQKDLA